jgi:hypothetical protein
MGMAHFSKANWERLARLDLRIPHSMKAVEIKLEIRGANTSPEPISTNSKN